MSKFAIVALLALTVPALALDRVLPSPRVKNNGDVRLSDDLKIGTFSSGKFTSQPDVLAVPGTGGYWLDRPNGASIARLKDRVLIGSDTDNWTGNIGSNGTSWPWTMGQGIFGYLPRNAMVWASNPFGTIGVLSSSRTGDSNKLPGEPTSGCCAIPFASLVLNDNTSVPQPAWGYYCTAVRVAGAGETHCWESDILNATGVVTPLNPYAANPSSMTLGMAIQSGGEGAPYNNPSNPPYPQVSAASAALLIGGNGSTFDKGIIIKSAAISPTVGGGAGQTVAMEMPANNAIRWVYNAAGDVGSFINSGVSAFATSIGLNFTDNGALFTSSTNVVYLQIQAVANAVNRLVLTPATTGQPVKISALGEANVDIALIPNGAGRVTIQSILKLQDYTVSALPACNATNVYTIAVVSDAQASGGGSPTYSGAIAGGGSVRTPVFCNGFSWSAH